MTTRFKLGSQSYKSDFTGSNNWVGAPKKISDLTAAPQCPTACALEKAANICLTIKVRL
jgi:uncharacterized protein DUF3373